MNKQKYIVNGINNDKIELVSKYDVRKLNRLLDAKDKTWIAKIKQTRKEIEQNAYPIVHGVNNHDMGMTLNGIFQILDRLIAESEG